MPDVMAEAARDWHAERSAVVSRASIAPVARISKFGRLPFHLIDTPGEEIEYLIDGFLTKNEKSVIAGASMSGKSFLAIAAAMSIATGAPLFGNKIINPGLVLYQAGEGARGIKKRLRAYRQHFDIPAGERVPFELLRAPVDLFNPAGDTAPLIEEINWIRAEYPVPLRLVVIDTLATATGGADENSGKDMGAVMANIDRIRRECDAAVCLVHHMNAGGLKLRGHTSVFANVDQVITVSLDDKTKVRTATLAKQKDDESGVALKFELLKVVTGHRDDGKEISSCVCLPLGEKELAQRAEAASGFALIKKEEQRIFTALMKAIDRYGQVAGEEHEKLGAAPGTKVVQYMAWRDVYAEMNPEEDGTKPDGRVIGQRFRNNKDPLVKFGIIGLSTPWMWWAGRQVRGFPETRPKANFRPMESQREATESQSGANGGSIDMDTELTF